MQEQSLSLPAPPGILPNPALNRAGVSARPAAVRRRAAIWAAGVVAGIAVLTLSLAFVRSQGIDLGAWLSEIWVLIAAIPAPFVIAACALKASEVALNAVAWTTVLRAAYPDERITFRQTLGVVQGGVGIFAVIPPKFGGFAVLGLYRAAFPTLGVAGVLATRVVQGISSTILGTSLLIVFAGVNAGFGEQAGFLDAVVAFFGDAPYLALPLTALVVAGIVILARRGRDWLRGFVAEMALGGAILRTPGRYALRVVFPTLLAFALRWGVTGTLLAAFAIPVSWETLLRVNVAHGLARSVQVTPGGFGTVQAFDLVALQGIAPVDVITAYSLSQVAILLVFNLAFGFLALLWAFGWDRTAGLLRLPRRGVTAAPAPQASAG